MVINGTPTFFLLVHHIVLKNLHLPHATAGEVIVAVWPGSNSCHSVIEGNSLLCFWLADNHVARVFEIHEAKTEK